MGNVKQQLEQAQELLQRLDIAQETRSLIPEEAWLRRQLKQRCLALASLNHTILRARSQIDWLSEGDANTQFFHAHAKFRKGKKYISKLHVGDRILTGHEDKEQAIWNFYNSLLGTPEPRGNTLNLATFYQNPHNLDEVDAPIAESEVWQTIKNMPMDKALGLDGFMAHFYKSCWQLIKHDVLAAVGAVHQVDARQLSLLNSTYIVLIPKKKRRWN